MPCWWRGRCYGRGATDGVDALSLAAAAGGGFGSVRNAAGRFLVGLSLPRVRLDSKCVFEGRQVAVCGLPGIFLFRVELGLELG